MCIVFGPEQRVCAFVNAARVTCKIKIKDLEGLTRGLPRIILFLVYIGMENDSVLSGRI